VASNQLASAVRDCPEEAARALREFEYKVERSAAGSGRGGRPDEAKMRARHRSARGAGRPLRTWCPPARLEESRSKSG
jgi:hypothetical protein